MNQLFETADWKFRKLSELEAQIELSSATQHKNEVIDEIYEPI